MVVSQSHKLLIRAVKAKFNSHIRPPTVRAVSRDLGSKLMINGHAVKHTAIGKRTNYINGGTVRSCGDAVILNGLGIDRIVKLAIKDDSASNVQRLSDKDTLLGNERHVIVTRPECSEPGEVLTVHTHLELADTVYTFNAKLYGSDQSAVLLDRSRNAVCDIA